MGGAGEAASLEPRGHPELPMTTLHRRAASLVELLLALALTGVIAGALAGLLVSAWQRFSAVADRLAVESMADILFRQIESDLQAAVIRADEGVWFAVTRQAEPQVGRGDANVADADWSGGVKPVEGSLDFASGTAARLRFGQAGLWLRFFTQVPDTADRLVNLAAPRAVSYQIIRRRLVANAAVPVGTRAPMTYLLYRGAARPAGPEWSDPDSCFAAGYNLFGPAYGRPDASRIDNVGNVRSPRRFEQVLAPDVVDFGLRIWTAQPDGRETCVFPQPGYGGFAATRRDGRDGQPAAVPGGDEADITRAATPLVYGFPSRVDVVLRILTPTGARVLRRLEAELAGLPGAAWWECVERESRVVVRAFRVPEVTP